MFSSILQHSGHNGIVSGFQSTVNYLPRNVFTFLCLDLVKYRMISPISFRVASLASVQSCDGPDQCKFKCLETSFPHCWPYMRGIHGSPVVTPHKGPVMWSCRFCFVVSWISCWTKSRVPVIWNTMTLMWRHSNEEIWVIWKQPNEAHNNPSMDKKLHL